VAASVHREKHHDADRARLGSYIVAGSSSSTRPPDSLGPLAPTATVNRAGDPCRALPRRRDRPTRFGRRVRPDARRCILPGTIAASGLSDPARAARVDGNVGIGGDVCQEVCQFTRAPESPPAHLAPRETAKTRCPIRRARGDRNANQLGRFVRRTASGASSARMMRNVAVALATPATTPDFARRSSRDREPSSPTWRGHAAWALARSITRPPSAALTELATHETDASVIAELAAALDLHGRSDDRCGVSAETIVATTATGIPRGNNRSRRRHRPRRALSRHSSTTEAEPKPQPATQQQQNRNAAAAADVAVAVPRTAVAATRALPRPLPGPHCRCPRTKPSPADEKTPGPRRKDAIRLIAGLQSMRQYEE